MLDWSEKYKISRGAYFQFEKSQIQVFASSAIPLGVSSDHFDIIKVFAADNAPMTLTEAYATISESWELPKEEFERCVALFIDNGIIVSGTPVLKKQHFALPYRHLHMIQDTRRVYSYRSAIERAARGRVVVELGCGSGILSVFAAQAGAEHVYAVEETAIIETAVELAKVNGVADRITFLQGNSRDVDLPRSADLLVHEILGMDPLDENVADHINDATRRWLAPDAVILPSSLEIVGIPVTLPDRKVEVSLNNAAIVKELGLLYGVNLSPLANSNASLEKNRRFSVFDLEKLRGFVGDEFVLAKFDFRSGNGEGILAGPHHVRITENGRVDGVLMFFRAVLDDRTVLSTSPGVEKSHWGWRVIELATPKMVERDQTVSFSATHTKIRGMSNVTIDWA